MNPREHFIDVLFAFYFDKPVMYSISYSVDNVYHILFL